MYSIEDANYQAIGEGSASVMWLRRSTPQKVEDLKVGHNIW